MRSGYIRDQSGEPPGDGSRAPFSLNCTLGCIVEVRVEQLNQGHPCAQLKPSRPSLNGRLPPYTRLHLGRCVEAPAVKPPHSHTRLDAAATSFLLPSHLTLFPSASLFPLTHSPPLLSPSRAQLFTESAEAVIRGVAQCFCEELEKKVGDAVNVAVSGLVEHRPGPRMGGQRGLVLFLKLYKGTFKNLLQRYGRPDPSLASGGGGDGDGDDECDRGIDEVVSELEEVCGMLIRAEEEESGGADNGMVELIMRRSLLAYLKNETPLIPTKLFTKAQSKPKGVAGLPYSKAMQALQRMATAAQWPPAGAGGDGGTATGRSADEAELDAAQEESVVLQLGPGLCLGKALGGCDGLFYCLCQIALGRSALTRLEEGHGALSLPEALQGMRKLLAMVVLERYEPDDHKRFLDQWGSVIHAFAPTVRLLPRVSLRVSVCCTGARQS